MCVIVVKECKSNLPKKSLLKDCFFSNPDGAGFMYARNGSVTIQKGYMSFEAFWTAYLEANIKQNESVVFHFRIATTGSTRPENCHPFPMSSDGDALTALQQTVDLGIAHNGMIDITPEVDDHSDTMAYIALLSGDKTIAENIDSPTILHLIEATIDSSRMAFLKPDGIIHRVGTWEKDDTLHVSNTHYQWMSAAYGYGNCYDYDGEWPEMALVPSSKRTTFTDLKEELTDDIEEVEAALIEEGICIECYQPVDRECPECEGEHFNTMRFNGNI